MDKQEIYLVQMIIISMKRNHFLAFDEESQDAQEPLFSKYQQQKQQPVFPRSPPNDYGELVRILGSQREALFFSNPEANKARIHDKSLQVQREWMGVISDSSISDERLKHISGILKSFGGVNPLQFQQMASQIIPERAASSSYQNLSSHISSQIPPQNSSISDPVEAHQQIQPVLNPVESIVHQNASSLNNMPKKKNQGIRPYVKVTESIRKRVIGLIQGGTTATKIKNIVGISQGSIKAIKKTMKEDQM